MYMYEDEVVVRRGPHPGISAVLSVLFAGLGQVYAGNLLTGALWCVATYASYAMIFLPGILVHAFCVWSAYRAAKDWKGY